MAESRQPVNLLHTQYSPQSDQSRRFVTWYAIRGNPAEVERIAKAYGLTMFQAGFLITVRNKILTEELHGSNDQGPLEVAHG
jgi:hypothetical protein